MPNLDEFLSKSSNGDYLVTIAIGDAYFEKWKELKGFKKITLKSGETIQIEMELTPRDLSFYDVESKTWKAEAGAFNILVGNSSDNILLKTNLSYSEN